MKERIAQLIAEKERAEHNVQTEQKAKQAVEKHLKSIDEARTITNSVAEQLQRRANDKIAKVVTRCLAAVFDDPYEFKINFVKKRGKTEAVLQFVRDDIIHEDPKNELGGGVIDVAALALRIATTAISSNRRTFFLDEPFRHVRGADNRRRTKQLLRILSKEFNVQWIVNTDIESYRTGTIIEME